MNEKLKYFWSFALGALLSAGGAFVWTHYDRHHRSHQSHWKERRAHRDPNIVLQKLTEELDLTPEQQTQISQILGTHFPKIAQLRESLRPQIQTIRDTMKTEVRAVLLAQQQKKYDELVAKFEERRRDKDR